MAIKPTITSIFMVPTLGISREGLRTNDFINAYVGDAQKEVNYDNGVYLLFKPKNFDKFKDFVDNEYDKNSKIVEDYDYSGGFVVLVYSLDPRFDRDFDLIKKGKYSKTSKEFQEQFPKTILNIKGNNKKEELSMQYRIFNKTDDLKEYWEDKLNVNFNNELELWDGFIEENEILNIDRIRDLI